MKKKKDILEEKTKRIFPAFGHAFDASVDENNVYVDHCVLWRQLVLVFDILQHGSKREQDGRVFVY